MKSLLFSTIFFLNIINSYSQSEADFLKSCCQNFNYKNLENGLYKLKDSKNARVEYLWHRKLSREIVENFYEEVLVITKTVEDSIDPSMGLVYEYKVKYIKKGDKLAYYQITETKNIINDNDWVETDAIIKEDSSTIINQLNKTFYSIYKDPLNYSELFEEEIKYGHSCGFGGRAPKFIVIVDSAVKEKNLDFIIKLLKSPNIERQLYAIDALYQLKKSGVKINSENAKIIDAISKKRGFARTCSGCLGQQEPINGIIKRIKN